jgi:hypothetical protein
MSYEVLVPGHRGGELRTALLEAIDRAYTENVDRYDPEGIGDDATWFGLSVSRNLWHIAEVVTKDIAGVQGRRASNTFFLELDGVHEIYFCKAPPGANSVEAVNFESHVRSRIITRNGSHLQMRLDVEGQTLRAVSDEELAHYAVIVHFGDPDIGFSHAVIGAPYLLPNGDFGWEWQEPFGAEDADEEPRGARPAAPGPKPKPDAGDFGLVLRDEDDDVAAQP